MRNSLNMGFKIFTPLNAPDYLGRAKIK